MGGGSLPSNSAKKMPNRCDGWCQSAVEKLDQVSALQSNEAETTETPNSAASARGMA